MRDLQIFNFQGNEVRTVLINNEVWFVTKDIANVLRYIDPSMMLKHVDKEDKQVVNPQKLASVSATEAFGNQTFRLSIINESGLYSSIISSQKPEAKQFKRWVTSEVLPTLRKTGTYDLSSEPSNEEFNWSELLIKAGEALRDNKQLEQQLNETYRQLQENTETVTAYRAILPADMGITIGTTAQALRAYKKVKSKKVFLGRNNLHRYLRQKGFLQKSKTIPYQSHISSGKAFIHTYYDSRYPQAQEQCILTWNGLEWLVKSLIADGYILNSSSRAVWDTFADSLL